MKLFVELDGRSREVDVQFLSDGAMQLWLDGQPFDADAAYVPGGVNLRLGNRVFDVLAGGMGDAADVACGPWRARVRVETERALRSRHGVAQQHNEIRSPMPGRVVKLLVSEQDSVEAGQPVLVVEAMKMQNELRAPGPGQVARILVQEGEDVEANALLLELSA